MHSPFKIPCLILLLVSCSSGPAPIEYGKDACDFCRMTIMDPKFGGEIVTNKGKVYKFDAIECMANYYHAHNPEAKHLTTLLVTNYNNPGKLINAEKAVFMKNDKIQSPMGVNLAAFNGETMARKSFPDNGKIMRWEEMLKAVEKNKR